METQPARIRPGSVVSEEEELLREPKNDQTDRDRYGKLECCQAQSEKERLGQESFDCNDANQETREDGRFQLNPPGFSGGSIC